MTRTFLAACFASGWLAWPVSPAFAQAGRLDFCARPVAPACVDVISTYKDSAGREACSAEVRRFLDMTFAYRRCLNGQLENEIRETNRINDRFKCRMKGGKTCP